MKFVGFMFLQVGSNMDQRHEQRAKQVANTEIEFREALKLAVKKPCRVVMPSFHSHIWENFANE